MSIADYLILIAAILPYVLAAVAKGDAESFDNGNPRNPTAFKGKALRAWNAQLNSFETFPFFAIAVLMAEFRDANQIYVNGLAFLYMLIRIVYLFLYLTDKPSARTPVWTLGFLIAIAIFLLPLYS